MASLPYDGKPASTSSLSEKPSDADVEKTEAPLVNEHNVLRPAWQRIVAGDAQEGHDTQRALNTRHIMMIGALNSIHTHPPPTEFFPQPSVERLERAFSSAQARCVRSPTSPSRLLNFSQAVSVAGPAGALLSYAIVGIFCYGVVITL